MKKKSLKRCLKKRMILLLGFLMMTGVAVAQQLQVQGKVTDATGEGLIGDRKSTRLNSSHPK